MNRYMKDYIEQNIDLIEKEDWNKFFEFCPVGTGYFLYEAGVDF